MNKINLFGRLFMLLLLLLCGSYVVAQKKYIPEGYTKMHKRPLVMPKYGDGMRDLIMYLHDNIVYPKEHNLNNEGGRVILRFTVDRTGKICHPIVVKSASPLFDKEALRVVSEMGQWSPGMGHDGTPIRMGYHIPVNFNTGRKGMVELEPVIFQFDLTSRLGKQLTSFKLYSKVGPSFETHKTMVKGDKTAIYYYYDRGDDVLNVGKEKGLYHCKVHSPRFTILDGLMKVGCSCPDNLEEQGWELIRTKIERSKKYINNRYDVPAWHATVSVRIDRAKGTVYSYEVTIKDEKQML